MIAALQNLLATAKGRKQFDLFAPLTVLLIAAILRLWNLGYPKKLVFDETYYVKDAWTLFKTGAERAWPADANPKFEAGQTEIFLNDPSFVVHPPLGKWIIGLGMWLFGPDQSFSWRISVAILGIASVALVIVATRILTNSGVWSVVAGTLMAIDGHAIVLSRTALLDGILTFFMLLAFWFLLLDRRIREQTGRFSRRYIFAAAVALGAGLATKWSAAYFILVFVIYLVADEVLRARVNESANWQRRSLTEILKMASLAVPAIALTYISSWLGWLLGDSGYDRDSSPNAFVALFNYHQAAYNFHVGLKTPHSYASNPLTWPLALRPTSFFYEGLAEGENGCEVVGGCSSAITALGNPLIWLGGTVAIIWLAYFAIKNLDRTATLISLGIIAGWVPWLFFMQRTVFQFYSIVFLPWTVMGIAYALQKRRSVAGNKKSFDIKVAAGLALAAGLSIFFLPIWWGTWIPFWFWQSHMWLPSWI